MTQDLLADFASLGQLHWAWNNGPQH